MAELKQELADRLAAIEAERAQEKAERELENKRS